MSNTSQVLQNIVECLKMAFPGIAEVQDIFYLILCFLRAQSKITTNMACGEVRPPSFSSVWACN